MSDPTPAAVPVRLFSKPVIDPINTVAWFGMDAFWLAKLDLPAYLLAAVTVVTGIVLLVLGRREGRAEVYADLGLNCWIVMNTVWMVYDLNDSDTPWPVAAVLGPLGAVFIVLAARHSKHLRRVRIVVR